MSIRCALLVILLGTTVLAQNGPPLEVNDFEQFMSYIGEGYPGVVAMDLSRCIADPPLTDPGFVSIKLETGQRIFVEGVADYAQSDFYYIAEDATAGTGILTLDSTGFLSFDLITIDLPSFETKERQEATCQVGMSATLYVYGVDTVTYDDLDTYEKVRDAFLAGKEVTAYIDGDACGIAELSGLDIFMLGVDWRLYNEGEANELLKIELNTIVPGRGTGGEAINTFTYLQMNMYPDETDEIHGGSFDVNGTDLGDQTWPCELGAGLVAKTPSGVTEVERFDTFEAIEEFFLSGREGFLTMIHEECDPVVDNYDQHRLIRDWQWLEESPSGGRAINTHHFFYGLGGLSGATYTAHQNFVLSEDGNAYLQSSIINMTSQNYDTDATVCPLGTGVYITTTKTADRTQLDTPEAVIEATRRGEPLSAYFRAAECTTESGFEFPNIIFGEYIRNSGSDSLGNEVVYYQNEMELTTEAGFVFSTSETNMAADGTFTINLGVYDAGSWEALQTEVVTCPFSAATVFN